MPGVDRYSAAKTVTAAALWILATATPVRAQTDGGSAENPPEPFTLSVPLECPEGERCWIVTYPDRDKSRNALDYNCGRLTKDRQRGSDFTIDGIDVMRQGIPVVASARGVVIGVRRNMKDAFDETSDRPVRSKKPCGNGVLIEHPGDCSQQSPVGRWFQDQLFREYHSRKDQNQASGFPKHSEDFPVELRCLY